ncbi:MAG: cupin domain-containing protein [Variibacter sp.]|nr:cupin domain-containing protein [Variibacter sp.]
MPVYNLKEMKGEFVTPKHSTAFGPLILGEHIEVGVLHYKAGEGANTHSHPHEQIIVVLSGKARFTLDGEESEIGPGYAVHIPANMPHSVKMIEDTDVVSCKNLVGGVGHKI